MGVIRFECPGTCGVEAFHSAGQVYLLVFNQISLLRAPEIQLSNLTYYSVCGKLIRNEKRFGKMLSTGNKEGRQDMRPEDATVDIL